MSEAVTAGRRVRRAAAAKAHARPWPLTVAALALCGLLVPVQLYVAIPLGGPVEHALGGPGTTGSALVGAFSLAYALGFLALGPQCDRFGPRPLLLWGLVALAATTALASAATSIETLLALRALQGLSAATFAPAALAFVAASAPAERRTAALACVTTGLISAGIAGQVYGSAAEATLGWRGTFAAAAAAYVACAAILAWLVPRTEPGAARVRLREPYVRMAALLRRPGLRALFAASLSLFGSFVAVYSVLRPQLTGVHGLGDGEVAAVEAAGLLGVAASPFASALAVRFGPRRVAVCAFAAAAGGVLLVAAAGSLAVVVTGTVVLMAGIAVANPTLVAYVAACAPDARGAAVSFNTFVLFTGATLGAFVPAFAGFGAACLVAAGVLLACGALVAGRAPEPTSAAAGQGAERPRLHERRPTAPRR